jgi:hypothetical protein
MKLMIALPTGNPLNAKTFHTLDQNYAQNQIILVMIDVRNWFSVLFDYKGLIQGF